jgi:hypothetical protein
MALTPFIPPAALSLLPRGNLLLQSQTFDNASWTKTNLSVTANQTTDVWGLATVDLITRASTAAAQLSQAATKSAASVQTQTLSFDAKAGTATFLAVRCFGSSTANRVDAIFNLSTGAVVSYGATGTFATAGVGATISASGVNGLFNVALTFATDAAATCTVAFSPSSVSQQVDGTGSANSVTVYLSQAQLEPYATQSAYALTTAAQDPGIWAGASAGLAVLPYLPGQDVAVSKAPMWSTQVIRSASGRERRTGSPVTVSIPVLSNAALTNADIWPEVDYLGSSGVPISTLASGRVANLLSSTSATAWPTDGTSNWTTTGIVGPVQQILSVTFTPQIAGFVRVKVKVAKPSQTVRIDPLLQGF